MEDNIKLYEYDYAAYFTGRTVEIGPHEGYRPGYLTTVPVPDNIPEGHSAKFEKHIGAWIITNRERPERVTQEQVMLENPEVQTEPKVM